MVGNAGSFPDMADPDVAKIDEEPAAVVGVFVRSAGESWVGHGRGVNQDDRGVN
jgi:hypothetical protein